MASVYVSPVFHATHGNYGCKSRGHSRHISIPSIQKMACPMAAKKCSMVIGSSHLNQQYARSQFSSSSPSVLHNMMPTSLSTLATKHLTKFLSTDSQLQHLGIAADRAAPIKAMQSSSVSSTVPPCASNSRKDDQKPPLTLSERWREIQGENHWEGLIGHPINTTLRGEIIRYGEFAQVCYDAFDFNQHSLYCGSCKYNRRVLFEKVDKGGCGYEVTKYLYATSKLDLPKFFKKSERKEEERWSRDANWIGYVAVCTDEDEIRRIGRRDILIAWRGTVTTTEWVDDLMTTQAPANIEVARNQPVNGPCCNRSSQIQSAINVELAESHHNPFATVKPVNASNHSPVNPNVGSIVPSQCLPTTNAELHSQPQDGGGMNVKADSKSGTSNTAYDQFSVPRMQASAANTINEDDLNKDGKGEKDAKYNATPQRHDRSVAVSNEDLNEVVKVESGFLSLYSSSKASSRFNKLSAGQQMVMEVKRLLQKYEGEEISISITGHSLGAALALLCAYDIAANVAAPPNTAMPRNTLPTTSGARAFKQGAAAMAFSSISSHTILLDEATPPHTGELGAANQFTELFTVAEKSATQSTTLNAAAAAPPINASNMGGGAGFSEVAARPKVAAKTSGTPPLLITVFSFAGPRVGNRAFKRRVEEMGVRVLRIVNVHDCVPKVPGLLFNERSPKGWPNASGYHHVGKELLIDFDLSPDLRHTRDLASHHNLEAHLHVLDGFHGLTHPFQSVFKRNPILVNKSSDFLQKEAFIPPYWWQESNKGLVKDPLTGQWMLASREDDHIPEIHHHEIPRNLIG